MEVVPLTLELGGGVHLVRHDASDGLHNYVRTDWYVRQAARIKTFSHILVKVHKVMIGQFCETTQLKVPF